MALNWVSYATKTLRGIEGASFIHLFSIFEYHDTGQVRVKLNELHAKAKN